jgi:hypothetical protein
MTEYKILIISDNAHGNNNIYTQIFQIEKNILDEIIIYFNTENKFYIFGEAVQTDYKIKYNEKNFDIYGEETNINLFFFKLLNGFSRIVFQKVDPVLNQNEFDSSIKILERIYSKLYKKETGYSDNPIYKKETGYSDNLIYIKYMELYDLINNKIKNINTAHTYFKATFNIPEKIQENFLIYKSIIEKINKNFSEIHDKFLEICYTLRFLPDIDQNIISLLDSLTDHIRTSNSDEIYNITLKIRDILSMNEIFKQKNTNIIIIMGGSHINNILTYLANEKITDVHIINKFAVEQNPSKQPLSGGYLKYKFNNLATILNI